MDNINKSVVCIMVICVIIQGCDILKDNFTWVYDPNCKLAPKQLKVWAESGRMRLTLRNATGTDIRTIEGDSETGNDPIWFDATGTKEPAIFHQSKFPKKMSAGETATVEDTSRETFTATEVYNEIDYYNGQYQLACEKKA